MAKELKINPFLKGVRNFISNLNFDISYSDSDTMSSLSKDNGDMSVEMNQAGKGTKVQYQNNKLIVQHSIDREKNDIEDS